MSAEQQYTNWGVEDFERYHSGKMTEGEMHALEKAALDDPFLEDALEGYAFTKTPVADIDQLKEKLWPENDVKTPVIWYKRKAVSQLMKVAAILILFGGIGWAIFNNADQKNEKAVSNEQLANNKQPVIQREAFDSLYNINDSAPIIAKVDPEIISGIKSADQQLSTNAYTPTKDNVGFTTTAAAPVEKDEMRRSDDRAADKLYIVPAPVQQQTVGNGLEGKVPGIQVESQPNKELAKKSDYRSNGLFNNQQNIQNQVRGRVIDNSGNPVPFASVKNNTDGRQVVSADADGNFILNNDVAANNNVKVEVNAAGYDQASTYLNNNSNNNTIVLNQSQNAMNEVVVTNAFNTKRKARETYQWNGKNTRIKLSNAEPLEGWPYFYYVMNDSIASNSILKQQQGRIVLEFNTDSAGAVKNVVIKKSLNELADNAALRILYKSPVLKVKSNKTKGEATIKLGL